MEQPPEMTCKEKLKAVGCLAMGVYIILAVCSALYLAHYYDFRQKPKSKTRGGDVVPWLLFWKNM